MASEEKTGSAYFLGSRSCISSAVAIRRPSNARLIIEPALNALHPPSDAERTHLSSAAHPKSSHECR